MFRLFLIAAILLASTLSCQETSASQPIHHALEVYLDPDTGSLQVEDTLTLPRPVDGFEFLLHAALQIESATQQVKLERVKEGTAASEPSRYRLTSSSADALVRLRYRGTIRDPLRPVSGDYSGGRESTTGLIAKEGVFLGGSSFWYPVAGDRPVTFSLRTHLPEGWLSVSQGRALNATDDQGWEEQSPQDEIYLIAGRFHLYSHPGSAAEARIYLRQPDEALAGRYLQATTEYINLYGNLLGPYPYDKFALVENFWESGYGMPSFTLLGPTVIRLPFILHSSYPHEILHNWWGNSVYVDYENGNWSEGLTSYLADHLIREQQGQGSTYRRDVLQRYADYVAEKQDFPLTRFVGRHGRTSQAVGYGKAMMFFHMLRRELGDALFRDGLRRFYRDNRFRVAGYRELQQAFETVSGTDLSKQFIQWTTRIGAPALQVRDLSIRKKQDRYLLQGVLSQVQEERPFQIRVPIAILLQGENQPRLMQVDMAHREETLQMEFSRPPLWISIDPLFDLFRQLDPSEIPSSIGQLFGAEQLTLVLPSLAPPREQSAYRALSEQWAAGQRGIEIVWDTELSAIPEGRMVWILGRRNTLADRFLTATSRRLLRIGKDSMRIGDRQYDLKEHSFVVTGRKPNTVGWISVHAPELVSQLARKLPHYGKYSYLIFQGNSLANVGKGQWPTTNSALSIKLPAAGDGAPLAPPEHTPLTDLLMN